MTKVRQDAWSHEDDLLLAETVLRHIREGSTQLDAFEEVGDKLNRTGAACGFRWNAIVRKKYDKAIDIAKRQRKQMKRAGQRRPRVWQPAAEQTFQVHTETAAEMPVASEMVSTENRDMSMSDVIVFLQNLQTQDHQSSRLSRENEDLKARNKELEDRIVQLEKENNKLRKNHQTIEEDYQALIGIMDRARRMVMLQDESEVNGPAFKMDKNGNLEKLAK